MITGDVTENFRTKRYSVPPHLSDFHFQTIGRV